MSRPLFNFALGLSLLVLSVPVDAQQAEKVPRIGFLAITSRADTSLRTAAFRQGLRDLGYVEGKNIAIDEHYGEGRLDRLRAMAAERVQRKVDVTVTSGPLGTRTAKEATSTIPIVMGYDNDPVGSGFIASLARPGGNITGLSTHYPEISEKQLELLKEIVPKLARVAVLGNSNEPFTAQLLPETELAAKVLRVQLQYLDAQNLKDVKSVLQEARTGRAGALLVLGNSVFLSERTDLQSSP